MSFKYTRGMLATLASLSSVWLTKLLFRGYFYNKQDTFSCAAVGVQCVRSGKFFHGSILFANIGPSLKTVILKSLMYTCIVIRTFFCARRARGAREANFFPQIYFVCWDWQLILMVQVAEQSFWGRLCSGRNTFSHAAGARRANFKKKKFQILK